MTLRRNERRGCGSGRRPRRARRPSPQSAAFVLVALVVGVATLSACDHTAPFDGGGPVDLGPRDAANPLRVTYNPGTDLRPAWLPDGSGFFYTAERLDRADRDRCFARMGAAGGTVLEQICDRSTTSDDSIATFESAALAPDGRLAYLRMGTPLVPASLAPRTVELRIGTRLEPVGSLVRSFPYTAPSGHVHQSLTGLQWLGTDQLIYVAEAVTYPRACSSCAPDTVRTGLQVVLLSLDTEMAAFLTGTDSATSVAVAGPDTIYFTRVSTTMIERRVLSSGAVTPAYDFGEAVGDVTTGGGRLAAVTGSGLWLVLPGGGATELTAPAVTQFRRPALSPDGRRLVVEGYANFSRSADLWLFDLP